MDIEIKKIRKIEYGLLVFTFIFLCVISSICIYGFFKVSKTRAAAEVNFSTRRFEDSKYVIVEKSIENVGNITVTVDKENKVVYVDEETIYSEEEE